MEKVRNLVYVCDGGIGKNFNGTAVLRAIKKAHPDKKIHAVAGYHDIFLHNPNIKKVYNFNNPLYFYEDYFVEDSDETMVLKSEPYMDYNYYAKEEHIVNSWCKQLGVEPDGIEGDIFFTLSELNGAKEYVASITDNFKKDLILLQWCGGKIPEAADKKSFLISQAEMYKRSLPQEVAQELVNSLVKKGYVVGVVGHTNNPPLDKTEKIFFPIRQVVALLKFAKTFIGIDSFLQHAAACNQIKNKGVVCWGGTNPKKLGYDIHTNLVKKVCDNPMCHRPNSFLFDHSNGQIWSCPRSEACLKYSSQEILEALDGVLNENKVHSKKRKNK